MKEVINEVKRLVEESRENLAALPKREAYGIGGTYYGSAEIVSSVGNVLEVLKDRPYVCHGYGSSSRYDDVFALKVGGTYRDARSMGVVKKLRDFIDANRWEIFSAGWVIVNDVGTNFSVYGIAKRN